MPSKVLFLPLQEIKETWPPIEPCSLALCQLFPRAVFLQVWSQTGSISIIWELVRKANSGSHPTPPAQETPKWGSASNLWFNKHPRRFLRTLEFKKHSLGYARDLKLVISVSTVKVRAKPKFIFFEILQPLNSFPHHCPHPLKS